MRRHRYAPLAAVLVASLVCGCGSAHVPGAATARSGPAIFAISCVACHSLGTHASPQQQGGDLLGYRLSRGELESFTRAMPAPRRPLTRAEVKAVSDYLFTVERHPRAAVR